MSSDTSMKGELSRKTSFLVLKLWVLIGIAFLLVGFLLMIGGGSDDPDVFNEAIFSFRRLTLAPILVLIGFCLEIYAIMKKPKGE